MVNLFQLVFVLIVKLYNLPEKVNPLHLEQGLVVKLYNLPEKIDPVHSEQGGEGGFIGCGE